MVKFFASIFRKKKIIFSLLLVCMVVGMALPQIAFAGTKKAGEACTNRPFSNECADGLTCYLDGKWTTAGICTDKNKAQNLLGKASDFSITDAVGKAIFSVILVLPLTLAGLLSFVAGTLLNTIIEVSTTMISYTAMDPKIPSAVSIGWPIARDLANMIIVLALIVIALATIIRSQAFQAYQAQKLLPGLIVAALLINFSLVMCGVVIDASNVTMVWLLKGGQVKGTAVQKFISQDEALSFEGLADEALKADGATSVFVMKIVGSIFYFITKGIVAFLYIFLFLFRIMALWILVILSPLAFACYVLPITKGMVFDKWLKNFLEWCFIGIFGALFMYLGSRTHQAMTTSLGFNGIGGEAVGKGLADLFSFFVPGMFMILGFIVSLQLSAMGANMATKLGKQVGFGAAKFTGKVAEKGMNWQAKKMGDLMQKGVGGVGDTWLSRRIAANGGSWLGGKIAKGGKLGRGIMGGTGKRLGLPGEGETIRGKGLNLWNRGLEATAIKGPGYAKDQDQKRLEQEAKDRQSESRMIAGGDALQKKVMAGGPGTGARRQADFSAAVELQLKDGKKVDKATLDQHYAVNKDYGIYSQQADTAHLDKDRVDELIRNRDAAGTPFANSADAERAVRVEVKARMPKDKELMGLNYQEIIDRIVAEGGGIDPGTGQLRKNMGAKGADFIEHLAEEGELGRLAKALKDLGASGNGIEEVSRQMNHMADHFGSTVFKDAKKKDYRFADQDNQAVTERVKKINDDILAGRRIAPITGNPIIWAKQELDEEAHAKISASFIAKDMDEGLLDTNFIKNKGITVKTIGQTMNDRNVTASKISRIKLARDEMEQEAQLLYTQAQAAHAAGNLTLMAELTKKVNELDEKVIVIDANLS